MNKLTVIYDVVRKMKDKETIKGNFKAGGMKDKEKIFDIQHTFEKDCKMEHMKGQTNMEVHCEGKKMKLENSIDFEGKGCKGHHGFFRHIHALHQFHHQHQHPHGPHCGGFKEGLNRLTSVLGILSSINLEEKEDGAAILSLESINIPEDVKKEICEKMKQKCEHHREMAENHPHHQFMKEFHHMDNTEFAVVISINKNREIEKISINLKGQKNGTENEKNAMEMNAVLELA